MLHEAVDEEPNRARRVFDIGSAVVDVVVSADTVADLVLFARYLASDLLSPNTLWTRM